VDLDARRRVQRRHPGELGGAQPALAALELAGSMIGTLGIKGRIESESMVA